MKKAERFYSVSPRGGPGRAQGVPRKRGYGEEELYKDPNYVSTYDDEFDPTYATYLFKVPEKWKPDFDLIMADKFSEVSDDYYQQVCEFYPKLAANGDIDSWLRPDKVQQTTGGDEGGSEGV